MTGPLTAAEEAWVDRQVAAAPPLTQQQVDTLARLFDAMGADTNSRAGAATATPVGHGPGAGHHSRPAPSPRAGSAGNRNSA